MHIGRGMHYDMAKLPSEKSLTLINSVIIPRPIAWVLSRNTNGSLNLAPFAWFNVVNDEPPTLLLSISYREDAGEKKDTWRNIENEGHFVVHIPSSDCVKAVVESSNPLPYGVSEVEKADFKTVQEVGWSLPRLACAKVALLCHRQKIIPLGEKGAIALILGEIKAAWIDDSVLDGEGNVIADKLDPLSHGGGFRKLGETVAW